ncbi:MAG: hypothetical protein Q9160_001205 [Pyrenula sp. 1 TL-2023]
MTIAVLGTSIQLDRRNRVYIGSEDVITGHVVVTCSSGTAAGVPEIFGPLKIVIWLHGRAKSKIIKSNGQSRSTYRGRAPLIRTSAIVHNDSFKGQPGSTYKFPFAIAFPPATTEGRGLFEPGGSLFVSDEGRPLPPSMRLDYRGFAHRFDCFVEYKLTHAATMPGINVRINGNHVDYSVRYEMPRVSCESKIDQMITTTRRLCVSNKHLLQPIDRPSGFKEKSKALFSSDYYPKHTFEVVFCSPQHLYVSSRPQFSIRIRHMDDSTAPTVPDVILKNFSVSLKAYTEVRAEKQIFMEQTSRGDESPWGSVKFPIGPFEKSRDWTWEVRGTVIPLRIAPSFKTYNISRRYEMKVSWILRCAEKDFTLERSQYVILHPPLTEDPSNEPSTSRQGEENFTEMGDILPSQDAGSEERLPTYQEAASQDRKSESSDEQPPAFDDEYSISMDKDFPTPPLSEKGKGKEVNIPEEQPPAFTP